MTPAFLIDARGQRFPIAEHFVIGRLPTSDLVLPGGTVTKRHVFFTRRLDDRIELEDQNTTNGTFVNAEQVQVRVLESGDVIDIAEHRLRFEQEPVRAPPLDPVLASIAAVWHDEAAVQVRIDELLERGDARATRLAAGVDVPLSESLAREVASGDLLVTRWRGFLRAARLRPGGVARQRAHLFELLRSEAATFLEELTLPDWSPRLGLEGFSHPTLARLRLGPFFDEASATAARTQLAGLTFPGLPRLGPVEVEAYRRSWIEFRGGEQRELSAGRREVFSTCSLDRQGGRWVVLRKDAKATLKVNRIERYSAELLPGDVVRAGELEFTLRAE